MPRKKTNPRDISPATIDYDRVIIRLMFMMIVQAKAICVEAERLRGGITPPPSLLLSGEKRKCLFLYPKETPFSDLVK